MDLLTPSTGLFFWQLVIFLGLFFILAKFAWKPILSGLKEREESIQTALDAAERAKQEMAALQAGNEKLLKEAREERDKILRDARQAANILQEQIQGDAKKAADKMIADARAIINTEKQAALRDVKQQVALFSLQVAEKLMKKNLADDKSQKDLIDGYIKDLKLN
ncbi:MAG TPA: F0F1 ATP synthase subunit B [Cyclobacteriaceae bacterium]|nr:F0F1 ATP synthase subunit B [Cyclobacteriaceae bacterium]